MSERHPIADRALLEQLREKARSGTITLKDLEDAIKEVENLTLGLMDFLNQVSYVLDEEDRGRLSDLRGHLAPLAYPVLFERVRSLAWALRDSGIKEDVSKSGYRLINLARAGRKDEVAYLLTRIFLARSQPLPRDLVRIFSPAIPDDMFRTFLYAFVGILSGESSTQEGGAS